MTNKIKHFKLFFTILLMFFTIGQISSVIYVPALPKITEAFKCTDAIIQWSVSSFMFGFAFSQFIYGSFSDKYGRRKTLSIGILIGLIGSVVCMLALTPAILIIGRLIQGFGLGVGGAMGYIVLRDLFAGSELARYGSILGMAAPLMVGIAPILGGYLETFFGWRSIFCFILLYGLFIWLAVTFLFQETKVVVKDKQMNMKSVFSDFRMLLSNRIFLGYTLCNLFAYSGFMAFYTIGPYLLAELGVSTIASGWLIALLDVAIIVGSTINIIFVIKFGINKMMFLGIAFMLIAGIIMLTCDLLGYVNAFEIIFPAFIFALGAVLIMCNAFSGAMTPFPEVSGTAGGLLGGLQMLGGAVGCSIVALFTTFDKEILLSSIYIILGIISIIALKMSTAKKIKTP
jgi:Bcr/CflA subfamily drug resistance transporter